MLKRFIAVLALAAGLGAGFGAQAQAPVAGSPATTHVDYADPANWLCRPDRQDACNADLDATILRPDGSTSLDRFHANRDAPIDCFYVYPTVSRDPGVNATMKIEPEEALVVRQQFARFAAKCRLFAPMYRQRTLTALAASVSGRPLPEGPESWQLAYGDVRDAWNEYLARDNHGRGVVLVGHSQGSNDLIELIVHEIDGKPVQRQLVSAILMGASLQVPPGDDVGGTFRHVPLCHSRTQIGCVVTFASFRASAPPPADSLFGQGRDRTVAACVNPAAPAGGTGALKAYMPTDGTIVMGAAVRTQPDWTNPPEKIDTPFVELPGLLSAECVSNAHGTYLAVTIHPTPGGRRVNDIIGDVLIGGKVRPNWGLHLVDANLTIGNLVDLVGDEARAYPAK